jgi:hypothetical protein
MNKEKSLEIANATLAEIKRMIGLDLKISEGFEKLRSRGQFYCFSVDMEDTSIFSRKMNKLIAYSEKYKTIHNVRQSGFEKVSIMLLKSDLIKPNK